MHCDDCGDPLSWDDALEYGRCFECEKAWLKRIRDWKSGRTRDPELDEAKARGLRL
jgi:hypothetical protein